MPDHDARLAALDTPPAARALRAVLFRAPAESETDPYTAVLRSTLPDDAPITHVRVLDSTDLTDGITSLRVVLARDPVPPLLITSARAATVVARILAERPETAPIDVYPVGRATAAPLSANSRVRTHVPKSTGTTSSAADAVADLYLSRHQPGTVPVFVAGASALDVLPTRLETAGVAFERVVVYATGPRDASAIRREIDGLEGDWCGAFFAPSGVRAVHAAVDGRRPRLVVAIGKTTAKGVEEVGWGPCDGVAREPTPAGLAEAVLGAIARES
ncbi:hypothetical protein AMAG_18516 [Allomyces macrogynus ATCC 38327]|uniref:Tetrapyrrole biosynthesis uroporphyrinogen III synthase domain-containing protein n=1 Tax=Allomyces macrogynus (strain ATCC 38327) TaxID=578462 RepID=A0A0L0SD55_ALLM3|nr:hypothetical protein AMAG_18516 [Allomyces macrogynus ATCC 38327]|eukprot:KNE60335.1 hypothetical protein AMAG_18516 [Allomyces macrogynus ATCC 38327]